MPLWHCGPMSSNIWAVVAATESEGRQLGVGRVKGRRWNGTSSGVVTEGRCKVEVARRWVREDSVWRVQEQEGAAVSVVVLGAAAAREEQEGNSGPVIPPLCK